MTVRERECSIQTPLIFVVPCTKRPYSLDRNPNHFHRRTRDQTKEIVRPKDLEKVTESENEKRWKTIEKDGKNEKRRKLKRKRERKGKIMKRKRHLPRENAHTLFFQQQREELQVILCVVREEEMRGIASHLKCAWGERRNSQTEMSLKRSTSMCTIRYIAPER